MTLTRLMTVLTFPVTVLLLLASCQSPPIENRKDTKMESQLYIEVIETQDGKHRFGIAHPGNDKTKLESVEIDLPPEGIEYPITLDGHKITIFCRYRKEETNKAGAGDGK